MIPTNHLRRRARAGVTALALSGLITLAACGGDEESSDGTTGATLAPAASVTTATTADAGSATDETATTDSATDGSATTGTAAAGTSTADTISVSVPVPDFDDTGLTDQQREIVEMVLQFASTAGVEVDTECLVDAIGQLSEDDAQKIIDAGIEGDPDLSAAGDAIGDEVGACAEVPDISVPDISIPDISLPDLTIPEITTR